MTTVDRGTGVSVEPPGYKGGALTFELTRVPERPGWLWEAYLGSTHVEHGWTRTKVGARIAMWDCIWRWRKWPHPTPAPEADIDEAPAAAPNTGGTP